MPDFNEAKLRGIDLRRLRRESFTSAQHIAMVSEHEFRAAVIHQRMREIARPERRSVRKTDTPKVQASVETAVSSDRNDSPEIRFTPEQLRVAHAALEKTGK
jgi:hypothetical protein